MPKTSRVLHPVVKYVLTGFTTVCMVFAACVVALGLKPGLAILPYVSRIPKSPFGSAWKGIDDATVKVKQAQIEREILAASHPVRKDGPYKLWSTPDGEFWMPDTSDVVLATLLAQQRRKIYGTEDSGGVKKGDIVLDGGAHIGVYVKTSLDAGAEKVVAIEPSPEALECLRRNFAKEIASGRVIVYPKGIWDEENTWCSTPTGMEQPGTVSSRRPPMHGRSRTSLSLRSTRS
jgi:hypothetical protein